MREREPTVGEGVSVWGTPKGKLPAVTEPGLKSFPPWEGTSLTFPVLTLVGDQAGDGWTRFGMVDSTAESCSARTPKTTWLSRRHP
jgi:hypothetical protein